MAILGFIGAIIMAAAIGGALYALAASVALARFFARKGDALTAAPPVTLFKPLHGAEPRLLDNLASFCRQDYPGPVQMVLGVQAMDDPAIAVVSQLRRDFPAADIALIVDSERATPNPKIANLINMLPGAKHDILVMSDADIAVAPHYLVTVVAALQQKDVGAVTCCYRGMGDANLASRLAAQWIDYQFLPGVVLGVATGLAAPCFGQTIALTRATLAQIGGFEPFGDRLAEDFAIGEAIRARGGKIAIARTMLINRCHEASLDGLFRHELRWAFTLKTIDPAGYAGSAITHMAPLALIAAVLLGFSGPALAALLAVLAVRLYLKARVDEALGKKDSSAWLLPLRDGLSFAVFIASFFIRRVAWRGVSYSVTAKGRLKS